MINDEEIRAKLATLGVADNPPSVSIGSSKFSKLLNKLAREWELDDNFLDSIVEIRLVNGTFEVRVDGSETWEEIVEE